MDVKLLRAIDANANRCREGLRVLEDIARFILDDSFLTEEAKTLRHELEATLAGLPAEERLASRDTLGDVGTVVSTVQEAERPDWLSLVTANSRRVEEALRVLEELAKTIDGAMAGKLKNLRYRSYTLEKMLTTLFSSTAALEGVQLYVLVDARETAEDFRRLVGGLVEAGVQAIQLRAKNLSDRELLGRARLLRQLTAGKALCIINDRADIAAIVNADGVHVGQEDLPAAEARRIIGPSRLIGISTHNLAQVEEAVRSGANYIGVGPIFPSKTKEFTDFPGVEFARQVVDKVSIPAFAIGGITLDNLPQVLQTGIKRVAVASAIVNARDPSAEARRFLALLREHRPIGLEKSPLSPGQPARES